MVKWPEDVCYTLLMEIYHMSPQLYLEEWHSRLWKGHANNVSLNALNLLTKPENISIIIMLILCAEILYIFQPNTHTLHLPAWKKVWDAEKRIKVYFSGLFLWSSWSERKTREDFYSQLNVFFVALFWLEKLFFHPPFFSQNAEFHSTMIL